MSDHDVSIGIDRVSFTRHMYVTLQSAGVR
jgi:hypothetical protein